MNIDFNIKLFSFTRRILISSGWIKFGIITFALLASTVVSFWGSINLFILIIALLVGLVGLLMLMREIKLGFIFIFLGGMFIPFSGPGGFNAAVIMVAFMLVLWLLDMFVVKRNIKFIQSQSMRPIFAMLIVSVVSFGVGQIPWFVFANQAPIDAQIGGFAVFLFALGSLILVANVIRDIRWLEKIVWAFIGLSAVYVIGRAIGLPFIDSLYQRGVISNSMFWTWLIALALSQAVYNNKLTLRARGILLAIVLIAFFVAAILNFDWKSGWVPPLVAAAVIIGLRYPKMLYLAIPVGLVLAYYAATQLIATDQYSWGTRVDAWLVVLDISRTSPIVGLGFANYYWYSKIFSIRGYSIRFNSHSQYVDLIAQTGIIGLLCFLWIFLEMGRLSWKLMRKLPQGFARAYSYGVFAGIIGTLTAAFLVDWVLPFVYNIGLDGFRASVYPWLFLGGLFSIEQIYHDHIYQE